jgi:hypothetical protein
MTHDNKQFMDMAYEIETLKEEVANERLLRNAAYTERNALVSALAHLFPAGTKKDNNEHWDDDWRNVVYIDTPAGQLSWHYHDSDAKLFADLPRYWSEYDGHSTPEKYKRLAKLAVIPLLVAVTKGGTGGK